VELNLRPQTQRVRTAHDAVQKDAMTEPVATALATPAGALTGARTFR
jgi:hypothetical protein